MNFEELITEAQTEGLNDTISADFLNDQALLYVDSIEEALTDNQRDTLVEAYLQGFSKGF